MMPDSNRPVKPVHQVILGPVWTHWEGQEHHLLGLDLTTETPTWWVHANGYYHLLADYLRDYPMRRNEALDLIRKKFE